jgi:anaerobic ribonucleoside-triphosphate reductase
MGNHTARQAAEEFAATAFEEPCHACGYHAAGARRICPKCGADRLAKK